MSSSASNRPAKRIRTEEAVPLADSTIDNNVAPSTPIRGSAPSTALEELTLVSMNIVGCQPSQEAPPGWTAEKATEAIRTEVLRTDPDVIALQECPGDIVWASRLFPGYQVVGAIRSHADQVMLLVRNSIQATHVPIPEETMSYRGDNIPAVVAKLSYEDRELLVASVHLAPFKEGAVARQAEMEALIKLTVGSVPFVIAGDTNMRVAEDKAMEKQLTLVDLWKQSGSDNATKWTWDTRDHGNQFNRYYGDSTREYMARYDRIYAYLPPDSDSSSTRSNKFEGLSVQSFELIANRPLTNKFHFLSDHFGISTSFKLEWN